MTRPKGRSGSSGGNNNNQRERERVGNEIEALTLTPWPVDVGSEMWAAFEVCEQGSQPCKRFKLKTKEHSLKCYYMRERGIRTHNLQKSKQKKTKKYNTK